MTEKQIAIADITIGKRYRKDFGDLKALAANIEERGLLQAIGVTPDNELRVGHRRLKACKQLGWKKIPARIITNTEDYLDALQAERDENEFRKPYTMSERVNIAESIEALMPKEDPANGCAGSADVRTTSQRGKEASRGRRKLVLAQMPDGFETVREYESAKRVVNLEDKKLTSLMDDGTLSPSQAATLATLPSIDRKRILSLSASAPEEVWAKTKEAKAPKPPAISETVLAFYESVLARPYGIAEQYGSITDMFDSKQWKLKANANRIGEVIDKVEAIARAYTRLAKECRAYAKLHGID